MSDRLSSNAGADAAVDLRRLLANARTIAVVGASPNPSRASFQVMAYLQGHGYRIRPVNPNAAGTLILGEPVVASLADLEPPVDIVDVFRSSRYAGSAVDDAIAVGDRLGVVAVWLQLGVRDSAAGERARTAGLVFVMDRCIKIDHAQLLGC
ncbi:MAG: CoA-binding protein [Rhodospirillales bacterium]